MIAIDIGDGRRLSVPAQRSRHHRFRQLPCRFRYLGTFGAMYLLGYSLDILSLMALTICHRFRGRRRDRRSGKHLASPRGGNAARAGGVSRRARGRIHRAVDQPVADRGVSSDPTDGRHPRPAVSRIYGDAVLGHHDFAGDIAHHDADDVRAALANAATARNAAAAQPVRSLARRLRALARLGVAA